MGALSMVFTADNYGFRYKPCTDEALHSHSNAEIYLASWVKSLPEPLSSTRDIGMSGCCF